MAFLILKKLFGEYTGSTQEGLSVYIKRDVIYRSRGGGVLYTVVLIRDSIEVKLHRSVSIWNDWG